MKTYARIEAGKVAELFATDGDITDMFHPSMKWVEVPAGVAAQIGWTYQSATFSEPIVVGLSANDEIISQITALEATVTPRRMREAALGTDGGWLKVLDGQIAELRGKLTK